MSCPNCGDKEPKGILTYDLSYDDENKDKKLSNSILECLVCGFSWESKPSSDEFQEMYLDFTHYNNDVNNFRNDDEEDLRDLDIIDE